MCILTIRSWPCGHSRCTSTDVCMDALSMPGTAPYDCPFATHSFQRQRSRDWPCPICRRRSLSEQESHDRDPGSLPASMSPREMQQQALRLQRAAREQQGQRAADLRRASQQLQQDRQSIGLPPFLNSAEQLHEGSPAARPTSCSTGHDAEDLTSGSSDTTSSPSSPVTPPYASAVHTLCFSRT
ncbi:hypothetical protein AC578_6994 [Pseudocercospora eumusae]|uniref:Uncharacterized protein n=1 Tax=Pseudocercospora eumusae TaxID=321146 RepID=A0A139GZF9_9PEZI|nr:hypothetical protein AC578_6994 [Pseudocercospora eumusae]